MTYTEGQLVHHPKWGLGKILKVSGDKVKVFFKEVTENPKTISTAISPLPLAEVQSDPWLDHLDLKVTESGAVQQYLTHKGAMQRFLHIFPLGFNDPKYIGDARTGERFYKWKAHELWNDTLGKQEFDRLLAAKDYPEIVTRAMHVESRTNLLATFEKAALRDAVKEGLESAEDFAGALHALIYGSAPFKDRFTRFADVLDRLPQRQTATLKWPIQTIFPFLALPQEHLFLKPTVTQKAAERRAFSLNYKPQPNWLTYSCLLQFGQLLMQDLAELKPRDMIDIQSFIYVTGTDPY
jgi:hypothetical protein